MNTADREKLLCFLANLKTGSDPTKDIFSHWTDAEVLSLAGDLNDLAVDLEHGLEYQE